MSELIPKSRTVETAGLAGHRLTITNRRTERTLATVEGRTLARVAAVRGHVLVQSEKATEIDRLAREAMSGQAMLQKWAQTLAQGDPFVADDLKFFSDLAKMAKGEIIADTASDFSRESR